MDQKLDRRTFVIGAGAGAALFAAGGVAKTYPRSRAAEYGSPLKEFRYRDVELAQGVHYEQMTQTYAVLMALDEDRLLEPFRMAVGMNAPGGQLGGWYSLGSASDPWRFGQWISALSRYCDATGDKETREKVSRLVSRFSETIEPTGKMFLYSRPFQAQGRTFSDAPYAFALLVEGLSDAGKFSGYDGANPMLSRLYDAAQSYVPRKIIDVVPYNGYPFMVPYYLFAAWERGSDDRYLYLAQDLLFDEMFDPLSRGQNALANRHAYSTVDSLNSALMAYQVLGEEKYLRAAINGFRLLDRESFATGGWGPNERLLPRKSQPWATALGIYNAPAVNAPGESILHDVDHFETGCGSYSHFNLTRNLLRVTKDPYYGDSMERIMYNAALGALPLRSDGATFYYSNYARYARKQYYTAGGGGKEWPCCSGTIAQLAQDYRINTYLYDDEGVFVNLYIPSTLKWSHNGSEVALRQSGQYPLSDTMTLTLDVSSPTQFMLRVRIPQWAKNPAIRVNGEPLGKEVFPGTFASISQTWRTGDTIEITLPRTLEVVPADQQHPNLVALRCGPLVLFAIGDDLPRIDRSLLLSARQTTIGQPEWRSGRVRFLPWWAISDQTYTTYHQVGLM